MSGQQASEQTNENERQRRDTKSQRIDRVGLVKELSHRGCEINRSNNAQDAADQNHQHPAANNQAQQAFGSGAQCEPNAKFASALTDHVGNDAIQSNRGKKQRRAAENSHEAGPKTVLRRRLPQDSG